MNYENTLQQLPLIRTSKLDINSVTCGKKEDENYLVIHMNNFKVSVTFKRNGLLQ